MNSDKLPGDGPVSKRTCGGCKHLKHIGAINMPALCNHVDGDGTVHPDKEIPVWCPLKAPEGQGGEG